MGKRTKGEIQTATATRIARDSLRLAIGQLEGGDYVAARDSCGLAISAISGLEMASKRKAYDEALQQKAES